MASASDVLDAAITILGETEPRVALTGTAVELLQKMWGIHGPLMFHQSGGCCDGSSPMCYPAGEFITAEADVLLGLFELPECGPLEFWMSKEQFNYWSHTHLTVDVVAGRGSGFSVEAPEGKRFLIRSRLVNGFTPAT
ncbi:UDP-glucose 4-epimerase [Arthrobacter sp. ERGS1:01]|uniref:DUF779 domain-containing protein n=1 Tax=Arthrobacter sp. ERGS1:01 TaxID=1704044 RepID=UPI0006B4BF2F|nr:DUF779 domain-containing protein [Arthrobacter sp. ERGS1:01]ALE05191.1 UDP-glucose 4-epimerase [Arthrobacter sp. ERGS1:01]